MVGRLRDGISPTQLSLRAFSPHGKTILLGPGIPLIRTRAACSRLAAIFDSSLARVFPLVARVFGDILLGLFNS